jgi:tRNA A37 threonylcarbamoyladenosine dehydratase
LNNKFRGQKIAIIGLGGTGSYILDLVAKTPVSEIHLYDGDKFLQHNAFRAPSAPSKEMLGNQKYKADYFASLYLNMHKRIMPHAKYVTKENIDELSLMTHVFICIDSDSSRKTIVEYLLNQGICFIDVGMGVNIVNDKLIGIVRTTSASSVKSDHIIKRLPLSESNEAQNEYSTNIQIADLNALNAVFAVIKWKKMNGFYQDLVQEFHSTYSINDSDLLNEETIHT